MIIYCFFSFSCFLILHFQLSNALENLNHICHSLYLLSFLTIGATRKGVICFERESVCVCENVCISYGRILVERVEFLWCKVKP
jgi:hypothetical protein